MTRYFACTALLILCTGLVAAQSPATAGNAQQLLELGDPGAALELLNQQLKNAPKDAELHLLRSTAHFMLGDEQAGRSDLDRCLQLDPANRQAWLHRGALDLAGAEYDKAADAFKRARQLDPGAPDNALNLGAAYLLQGKRDAASHQFNAYLAQNQTSAEAFYLVATNYAMADRGELAIPLLRKAVQLDERMRLQARTDANFSQVANEPDYLLLLSTDTYVLPEDHRTAVRRYEVPFSGRASPALAAVLSALQIEGVVLEPQVEVTPEWALLWGDFRTKLSRTSEGGTLISFSAPPDRFTASEWSARTERLFQQVTLQLQRLQLSRDSG